MSSRRYVKRVWRVPKGDARQYLCGLLVKMLVKHGWPAKGEVEPITDGVVISSHDHDELPEDFVEAVRIASAIIARTYRIELTHSGGWVGLLREYQVLPSGQFKEVKG